MAIVFNANPGEPTSNSYATVAQADDFLNEARLFTDAWDTNSDGDKEKALMWATREIDRFDFIGRIGSLEQSLKWPRTEAYLPDGRLLASDEIPQGVVNAVSELAFWLIQVDRVTPSDGELYKKVKVGPIEVVFRDGVPGTNVALSMPDEVTALLDGLLVPLGFGILTSRV